MSVTRVNRCAVAAP